MLLKKCILLFFILICISCGLFAQVDNQTNNRISSIEESEISENILLPDLAKQSESIEQQSGEIAERGMPT